MLHSLIPEYEQRLRQRGLKGVTTYRSHLRSFSAWLASQCRRIDEITATEVGEFLRHRQALGHNYGNLATSLSVLRDFFSYARGRGLACDDPTQGISCHWLDKPGGYSAYQGVLKGRFRRAYYTRKFCLPLFEPFWESYLRRLLDQGYSRAYFQEVLLAGYYFHRYLLRRGIRHLKMVTPRLVDGFLGSTLRREVRGGHLRPRFLKHARPIIESFMAFIRHPRPFRSALKPPESRSIPRRLLDGYAKFAQVHLGLRPITWEGYLYELVKLGAFLDQHGRYKIGDVTVADLDDFLSQLSKRMTPRGLQHPINAVRSFLRYLHLHGKIRSNLAQHLVSPCRFRQDLLPKYIPWNKVLELLAGIDRRKRAGKRDYAILVLCAHHGLRAREIVRLTTSDLDWENGCFLLRERKNGGTLRLPLSEPAKAALQDYLSVRPAYAYPQVFLTEQAPIKPLTLSACVAMRLHHLSRQIDCPRPHRGSNVLRHSFAKALLDRGASLVDIAALLGQDCLDSTMIYTRVATNELREVADNYADLIAAPQAT